jgi:hypothetical protein
LLLWVTNFLGGIAMGVFQDFEEELENWSSIEGESLLKGSAFWEGVDLWLPETEAQ